MEELKKNEDKGRFMYLRTSASSSKDESGGAEDADVASYKRYRLSDNKTFDSLFFPEKEKLLNTLSLFSHKEGKYAIKGYPHKLGLLLFGPPGTGKTSLIKALAAHTQRNVVMVNLAAIKTNQELMDIIYDGRYKVSGEDVPVKLSFKVSFKVSSLSYPLSCHPDVRSGPFLPQQLLNFTLGRHFCNGRRGCCLKGCAQA